MPIKRPPFRRPLGLDLGRADRRSHTPTPPPPCHGTHNADPRGEKSHLRARHRPRAEPSKAGDSESTRRRGAARRPAGLAGGVPAVGTTTPRPALPRAHRPRQGGGGYAAPVSSTSSFQSLRRAAGSCTSRAAAASQSPAPRATARTRGRTSRTTSNPQWEGGRGRGGLTVRDTRVARAPIVESNAIRAAARACSNRMRSMLPRGRRRTRTRPTARPNAVR